MRLKKSKNGLKNKKFDALSRPVLQARVIEEQVEAYISQKTLDPYENENLFHFLKYRNQSPGI